MVTSQTKLRVTTLYPKSGDMAGQTGNIRTPLRPSGQQAMGQSTATVIKNYADSIPENGRAILSNIVKFPDNIVKFPDNESDTKHKADSKKRRREDSEESSISDSASPSAGKKPKTLASEVSQGTHFFPKRCFLPKDRDYLRTLFFKDNEPPRSLQEVKILFLEKICILCYNLQDYKF